MEIEVKAKLKDKDAIVQKLMKLGCEFSDTRIQDDMVWAKKIGSLKEFLSNDVFLRIRIQDGDKVILTIKSPKAKTGDVSLIKQEHEVVVSSAEEARSILLLLGLKEAVRIIKRRQVSHYKDYEICIDDIEDLGVFIEVEKIAEEKNAVEIQKDMFDFLVTLGVSPDDQVKKGYDILM